MKFEFDHRTGNMVPKKDENIYFGGSISGGLRVDDRKNNITYIIERDGSLKRIFGNLPNDNINIYDERNARIIADRVMRKFGREHKFADFRMFSRAYRMKIDEGRMGRLVNAGADDLRKEDKSMIQREVEKMEWVDLGLPSKKLWAKYDLRDEKGIALFTYPEFIDDFKNNTFEFPMTRDIRELYKYCDIKVIDNSIYRFISRENSENYIEFYVSVEAGKVFPGKPTSAKRVENDGIGIYPWDLVWPCISDNGNMCFYSPVDDHIWISDYAGEYKINISYDRNRIFVKKSFPIRIVKNK